MGELHIKNKLKGDAFVKGLTKNHKRVQADVEIGEGAGVRLERMEKEIAEIKEVVAGLAGTVGGLHAWKLMQEMKNEGGES